MAVVDRCQGALPPQADVGYHNRVAPTRFETLSAFQTTIYGSVTSKYVKTPSGSVNGRRVFCMKSGQKIGDVIGDIIQKTGGKIGEQIFEEVVGNDPGLFFGGFFCHIYLRFFR